jgi:DHA1 family multidrug resistance protein-like MFS transporter
MTSTSVSSIQKPIREQIMVLIFLLANIFIAFVGVGLIIPVMPMFMEDMGLSGSTMGYLMAAMSAAQLVASPFAGRLVDRYGRKFLVITGLLIFAVSQTMFGLGTEVWVLYLSRFLGGIGAAFSMTGVTTYLGDVTTIMERAKAMGYMAAAITLGFIIGPAIGGYLAALGVRVPFFCAAGAAFLVSLISLFVLRESLSREQLAERRQSATHQNIFRDLLRSLKPPYVVALLVVFVMAFGLSAYEQVFSIFVAAKFNYTSVEIATLITLGSIASVIVQLTMFDRMVLKVGEKRLIQICLCVSMVIAYVSTIMTGFWLILVLTTIIWLAFDILRPTLGTFLSRMAGKDQGFIAGMNSTYTSLGNIVGPSVAGMLFDVNVNYPYYFAAIVMLAGLLITFMWHPEQMKQNMH